MRSQRFLKKKTKSDASSDKTLQERKEIFEDFLKVIVERFHFDNEYMKAFLKPETELPDSSKLNKSKEGEIEASSFRSNYSRGESVTSDDFDSSMSFKEQKVEKLEINDSSETGPATIKTHKRTGTNDLL